MVLFFKKLRDLIWQSMVLNTEESKPYFFIIGWFLLIAYPGFYFLNHFFYAPNGYENLLIRLIIGFLGLTLLLFKYWPSSLKKITPILFYLILFLSFPFFFSYMLFKEPYNNLWQINELTGLILLTIFTDLTSFLFLATLGIYCAFLCAANLDPSVYVPLISVFGSYSSPIICLLVFAKQRKQLQNERYSYAKQIEKTNEQLELKVIERTQELQKALNAKTDFLNNISHEIRTPIQAFTSMSEGLVAHWKAFDENKKIYITQQIANSSKRLQNLLNNLLDLSKFISGKMFLDSASFNFIKTMKELAQECSSLYLNKSIDFNYDIKPESFNFIADKEKIEQTLRNLLFNALKFTPNDAKINFKAYLFTFPNNELVINNKKEEDALKKHAKKLSPGSYLYCSISDNGIGIPETELESIFTPFTQSSSTTTKAGGTGLGLSIAKETISAHNGKIWAFNNDSQGATFAFLIPQQIPKNKKLITPVQQLPSDSKNILIIDDEEYCLSSMELLLHGTQWHLLKAIKGAEGLEILRQNRNIAIIFLDLMMPDIDGLEILKQIKNTPEINHIPVIIQTGASDKKLLDKAYDLGATSILKKPYTRQSVLSEIEQVVGN